MRETHIFEKKIYFEIDLIFQAYIYMTRHRSEKLCCFVPQLGKRPRNVAHLLHGAICGDSLELSRDCLK